LYDIQKLIESKINIDIENMLIKNFNIVIEFRFS